MEKCRRCDKKHDRYKVFKGISSIDYSTNVSTREFKCSNGHSWTENHVWFIKHPTIDSGNENS